MASINGSSDRARTTGTSSPRRRRADVSRQSGWIAPVVVAGGVVSGTWELDGDDVRVAWFREAGKPPRMKLEGEVSPVCRASSIAKLGLTITEG